MPNTTRRGAPLDPKTPAFTSAMRRPASEAPVAIKSVASLGGSPAGTTTSASAQRSLAPTREPVTRDQPIPLVELKHTTPPPAMTHTVHYSPARRLPTQTVVTPSAQSNVHTYPPSAGRPASPEEYRFRPFPTPMSHVVPDPNGDRVALSPVGRSQAGAQSPRGPLRTDGSSDTLASLYVHYGGVTSGPTHTTHSPTETSIPGVATAAERQRAPVSQTPIRPAFANATPFKSDTSLVDGLAGLGISFPTVPAPRDVVRSASSTRSSTRRSIVHPNDEFVQPSAQTNRFRMPPPQYRRVGTPPRGQFRVSPTHGHYGPARNALPSAQPGRGFRATHATPVMRKRTVTIDRFCRSMESAVTSVAKQFGPLRGCTWSVPGGQKRVPPWTIVQFHVVFERNEDAAACVATAEDRFGLRFAFDQDQWRWEIDLAEDVSSDNLYMSGLPLDIDEPTLYKLLEPYGLVKSCKINTDSAGNRKGTAFARLESRAQAEIAIYALNGTVFVDPWTGQPFNGSPMEVKTADCPIQKMLRDERAVAKRSGRANTQDSGPSAAQSDTTHSPLSPISELGRLFGERYRLLELLKQNEQEIEALTPVVLDATGAQPSVLSPPAGHDATGATAAAVVTPPWRIHGDNQRQQHPQQQQQSPTDSASGSSPESSWVITPTTSTTNGTTVSSQGCASPSPQQAIPNASQSLSSSQAASDGGPNTQIANKLPNVPLPAHPPIWHQGGHLPAVPASGSVTQLNIWAPINRAQALGPVSQGFDAALRSSLWPDQGSSALGA